MIKTTKKIEYTTKGMYRSYLTGFIFSSILITISFWMTIQKTASTKTLIFIIITCAMLQILVQLICFMHLNLSYESKWNVVALLFTILIIVIFVRGSTWIMSHLHYNLMGLVHSDVS